MPMNDGDFFFVTAYNKVCVQKSTPAYNISVVILTLHIDHNNSPMKNSSFIQFALYHRNKTIPTYSAA